MKVTRKEIGRLWKFVGGNLKPDEERLLYLYYKKNMQKQQIAKLFSINNTTATYRIERCVKKLRYEYLITKVLPVVESLITEKDFKVFILYAQTRNQQRVAKTLGLTQGAISQRLKKVRNILLKVKSKDMKDFVMLASLKLSFWSWPNEKKMFSNALIKKE